MQLFYAPDISKSNKYTLTKDESTHCIGVLRYSRGQKIQLTDGRGSFYDAIISDIVKKQVVVSIENRRPAGNDRNYRVHIAIAPTKSIDRFEWFLEKATEIGIDTITPLLTENSERITLRTDRLIRVVVAAIKQSYKAILPVINPLISFEQFLKEKHPASTNMIATCIGEERIPLSKAYTTGEDAIILIGPEGDFSTIETEYARKSGFIPVSMGTSRLRTETAGIVAAHSIYFLNNVNSSN
jgi:16S rRNA (uracil1498-N3)-methyltransferase